MLREPNVAVATLRQVTAEVRRLSDRVFEFSTMVVKNRIHAELIRLAGEINHRNGEAVLSPAPSLSDIATASALTGKRFRASLAGSYPLACFVATTAIY